MDFVPPVTFLLSLITFISQAGLLLLLVLWLARKHSTSFNQFYVRIKLFFTANVLVLAFMVTFTATLGSLFYSEIALYEPCRLCWFQRIFMYPQVIIFAVALYKKTNDAFKYSIPLAIIGGLIAAYHYSIQLIGLAKPSFSDACSMTGVSCVSTQILKFGYITIPLMSLTAFVLLLVFAGWQSLRTISKKEINEMPQAIEDGLDIPN